MTTLCPGADGTTDKEELTRSQPFLRPLSCVFLARLTCYFSEMSSKNNLRSDGRFQKTAAPPSKLSSSTRYDNDYTNNSNDSSHSGDSVGQRSRLLADGQQGIKSDSGSSQSDLGPYSHIGKGSMGHLGQRSKGAKYGVPSRATPTTTTTSGSSAQLSTNQSSGFLQVGQPADNRWSYNSNLSEAGSPRLSMPRPDELYLNKGVAEPDDYLHISDGKKDKAGWHVCSTRGIANCFALLIVFVGLLALFAGYPIISAFTLHRESDKGGFNLGGTNGTGQVPIMEGE